MTTQFFKEVIVVDCVVMTGILIAGSVSDLREYRISNLLILAGWLTGLAFQYSRGGIGGMGGGICRIIITVIIAWPLFLLRAVGAGDIKLISVIAVFYGFIFLGKTIIVFTFLSGAVSLIQLFKSKKFLDRFHHFMQYILYNRKQSYYVKERDGFVSVIPLTPCLAFSYYFVLIYNEIIMHSGLG